jgi:hypothetical protein
MVVPRNSSAEAWIAKRCASLPERPTRTSRSHRLEPDPSANDLSDHGMVAGKQAYK